MNHPDDVDETPGSGGQTAPGHRSGAMRMVAATLVALVFAGAAVGAGAWMTSRDEPDVPAARGIMREDPEALSCQEAVGQPEPTARRVWPGTFAGLWLRRGDRALVVAFTEQAEAKVAKLAECFPSRTFAAVTFERSLREMEGRLMRMVHDRELVRAGELSLPGVRDERYGMGIDMMGNVIYVTLEEVTLETIATFKARYGEDVVVEEGPVGGPGASESA